MTLTKVENAANVPLFRGDPRYPKSDMDTWLAAVLEHQNSKPYLRPYLYGSDAGFCARRNVLLEHNTWLSSDVNSAGKGYMAIGVAFENLLAENLRNTGRLLTQDFRLVTMPSLKISGKIDLIAVDSEGELALLEIKTCGELPTAIKPNHLAQVQIYCAVSGFTKAWVIYLSRNLSPKMPLPTRSLAVDTSEEALTARLTTALISRAASDTHQLPPQPAGFRKHTECHYCEFRDYFCWTPRPGLRVQGGNPPAEPPSETVMVQVMEEMDTVDYIKLDQAAKAAAKDLYTNSPYRYLETLQLLADMTITENQRVIVEEEIRRTNFKLLNPLTVT